MTKNDIIHISLAETNKITDEEIIKTFKGDLKKKYDNSSEKKKILLIEFAKAPFESKQNEDKEYTINKINAFDKIKLIEKIKENLPFHYHNVFNSN